MSLLYFYITPADLLNKSEREERRFFESVSSSRKEAMCDHFFNFCVTAHSIRDWIVKTEGLNPSIVDVRCNKVPELATCRDIANASKHFSLKEDRKPIANGVVLCRSSTLDVFDGITGGHHGFSSKDTIELWIVIQDMAPQNSQKFTGVVISAWKEIFNEYKIPFRPICQEDIE